MSKAQDSITRLFGSYAKEEQKKDLSQSYQGEDTVGSAIDPINHLLSSPGFGLGLRRTMVGY